ncbi:MAG: hypothetical protein WC565_08940 [Parcubacteria group bacterium]|jgi:hypothetical protein
MPQLGGFDVGLIDKRPWRLRVMHESYGRDPEHTCGQCRHLVARRFAKTYYKCDLTRETVSAATDWRTGWQACGRFEEREE